MENTDLYHNVIARSIYKLKLHRELKGLNQNQMADLLGLSSRTYQRIEALESHLDYPSIIKICDILNLNIDYFIAKTTPHLPEFIDTNAKIEDFALTDDEKSIVDSFNLLKTQSDVLNFLNEENFKSHKNPLFISMNTKKYANLRACSLFSQEKSSKVTHGFQDPMTIINYMDFIFKEKPTFSVVKSVSLESKNNRRYSSQNIHKYFDNDVVILSLLRELH